MSGQVRVDFKTFPLVGHDETTSLIATVTDLFHLQNKGVSRNLFAASKIFLLVIWEKIREDVLFFNMKCLMNLLWGASERWSPLWGHGFVVRSIPFEKWVKQERMRNRWLLRFYRGELSSSSSSSPTPSAASLLHLNHL